MRVRVAIWKSRLLTVPRSRSTAQFDAALAFWPPWLLAAGGVLVSALLAALVRQQASGRLRAEARSRGRRRRFTMGRPSTNRHA